MKNTKIHLLVSSVILLLAVFMFAQATFAYFSSQKKTTATITSGSVKIVLTESAVKYDSAGNLVEDPNSPAIFGSGEGTVHDYGVVFPGQTIFKNPTIHNTGTNDAFLAAKITISDGVGDIHKVIGFDGYDDIDLSSLFSGGFFDEPAHFGKWNGINDVTYNDTFAMIQVPKRAESKYDVYFFVLDPTSHGESVLLFDQIQFSPDFSSAEMEEFTDLRIDICGFGVQTYGFDACFDAMLGALPDHFTDFSQSAP